MPSDAPAEESGSSVRFSTVTEVISPKEQNDVPQDDTMTPTPTPPERTDMSPEVQSQLRDLTMKMQKSQLQARRMENFAFEPVSLPASRAPSPARSQSRTHSRTGSVGPGSLSSAAQSPHMTGQSPPLTPSGSHSRDSKMKRGHGSVPNIAKAYPDPANLTPQMSPPNEANSKTNESKAEDADQPDSRHGSSSRMSRAEIPKAILEASGMPQFMVDRANNNRSASQSREASPPRRSSGLPRNAADRKQSGSQNDTKSPTNSTTSSSTGQPRKSGIFAGLYTPPNQEQDGNQKHHHHDGLKRFFKLGGHKHKNEDGSRKSSKNDTKSNSSHRESTGAVPFADDHGLESKYGKFGKVLGTGAGGSVRLMKRSSDGTTFAVKQFRARHPHESERDYNRKVTAEFCVGSTLHHGNIIETMDIVQEKGHWYEVMEYAPYDLFAIVMTGKMSREEVTCSFMQIMNGVAYLHSMGLAHRDLKLDNVVVNDSGITKLIDFGSAVVFRYPFEDDIVKASGIVGSDPYLAPEVYDEAKYDPEAVDVWSLGIIYCCMALRRFPWKLPRLTDVSYKYFVSEPTPGTPSVQSLRRGSSSGSGDRRSSSTTGDGSQTASTAIDRPDTPQGKDAQPTPTIKGPWRLLRLLPRESRYIIGRMLDTNPRSRVVLEDVQADDWIASRDCCRQDEGGRVHRAKGHEHTLAPPSSNQDEGK